VRKYREAVDRESAHEKLTRTSAAEASASRGAETPERGAERTGGTTLSAVLNSPLARSVATAFTRGVLGALLGSPRRRRRN
jgi:hypothetical protein